MTMKFITGWYVLYVRSRHEKKICKTLKDLSIETFLPIIKTLQKWSDRKKIVEKPLFPSYVLVNLKSSLEFHKALSISGACAYIRFGKEYARVSEDEVNRIKLLIGINDIKDIETSAIIPKVGEVRTIEFGSLSGLECEILKVDNINKIVVRIESLQQNITAIIPSYYFETQTIAS